MIKVVGCVQIEILLQIALDKVSLEDGVKVAFEVEEYQKYLF